MGMVVNGRKMVLVMEHGGILVLMCKALDEFHIRNYPFECGSKGGKSKTHPTQPILNEYV